MKLTDMQVNWFGCMVNQTAFYTPRNDLVAICSTCHSFGTCYGKFYTFYLPYVKSIPFANVYNFTSNNVLELDLLFALPFFPGGDIGAPKICIII